MGRALLSLAAAVRIAVRAGVVAACVALLGACSARGDRAAPARPLEAVLERTAPGGDVTGIRVTGLGARRAEALRRDPGALRVYLVDGATGRPLPVAVAGRVRVGTGGEGSAEFTPRFPLSEGSRYLVSLGPPRDGGAGTTAMVAVPAGPHPEPRVDGVYPAADVVPENLLKVYLHFTTPMRRGEAATHVALLDDAGRVVRAFLRPDAELWDHDDRTLTLFFDPARVKTGLVANRRLGRALRRGHRYRLVVVPGWPSAEGVPLRHGVVKTFRAVVEDRARVDERAWRVTAPRPGSRDALVVAFGEAMDHLLLRECLAVLDGRGTPVPGAAVAADQDRAWRFVPARPWAAGRYTIAVDPSLEDLAGNDLVESFDRPPTERPRRTTRIGIPVTVGAPRGG